MASYATLELARAAYLANADYADGAGDLVKAQDFRSACRALLVLMPQSAGQGGAQVTMSMAEVARQLSAAEAFVGAKASATAPRTVYTNVSEFRS